MENKFDLVVIGAGSGGLAAAKRAASYGAKVAIIEGDKIGGTCVIRGCVPKKLMVFAANARKNIISSEGYGFNVEGLSFSADNLLKKIVRYLLETFLPLRILLKSSFLERLTILLFIKP